jgi:hypothetical protein
MNLLSRNFVRALVIAVLFALYSLNPANPDWTLLLRFMHAPAMHTIFGTAWLLLCGLDIALGSFGVVSSSESVVSKRAFRAFTTTSGDE